MADAALLAAPPSWFTGLEGSDVLGTLGVVIYVACYLALQLGLIRGDGYLYPSMNLVAALSILVSLANNFNAYSFSLETAWVVISIIGISRLYIVHRFLSLSDDEKIVAQTLVPGLKKDGARRLIRRGRFIDAMPGVVLATEGKPVSDLVVILEGQCVVELKGHRIAQIGAGALVGEMTYRSGGAATASVRISAPSRIFMINCDVLRGLMKSNASLAEEFERNIAADLRSKLEQASGRLSDLNAGVVAASHEDRS